MWIIPWIITLVSIIGVVLNIKMNHWGFACWIVSNIFWTGHNYKKKDYAQSCLFAILLGLAIYGFLTWK